MTHGLSEERPLSTEWSKKKLYTETENDLSRIQAERELAEHFSFNLSRYVGLFGEWTKSNF